MSIAPEPQARETIDARLAEARWAVQDDKASDSTVSTGIPLSIRAEQTRIVAEVERGLSVVEERETIVIANLQRATHLRQAVLQKAFVGQRCTA